jgi:CRP-like cAMP-binding protein
MITAHLRKLRVRSEISAEEERVVRGLVSETRNYRADEVMVRSGREVQSSMLLLDGWAVRSKDLRNGDRQVTEIHVPGDFPDLHGFTLKRLDHDVMTLTECVVGIVPHERLLRLTESHPHLTRVYWLATNIDAAITREAALSLGRRSAISRMAHLFCELHARLGIVGRTDGETFEFPLTQRELGECLGLTVVHVNRTLQALRRKKLVKSENRQLSILDRRGLESIADFDPTYLQLRRRQLA